MPAKAYLFDLATDIVIRAVSHFQEGRESKMLTVTDVASHYGHFKSATYNNEAGATLVAPSTSGSLRLTDLIVTSEKQVGGKVTVQFYDGTNTVLIAAADADSPIQLAVGLTGSWKGWKDAYIQVIVSAVFDATVSIGYIKLAAGETLGFDAWNAER